MPTQGSPPKALAPSDTWIVLKSAAYTLGAAIFAAAVVAGLDGIIAQVIPDLEKRGVIDATLAVLLTTVFDAIRKAAQVWIADTRRAATWLVLALTMTMAGTAYAVDPVTIDVSDKPDGEYPAILVVKGGQVVDARPLKSVRLSGGPSPTPQPPPPGQPTAFEAEVERQARAAIAAGGTLTTGAGLCEVYFVASSGVANGNIADHTKSLQFANAGAVFVLAKGSDSAQWAPVEKYIRDQLQVRDSTGELKTKADYVAALKSVADALSRATSHKPLGMGWQALDISTAKQAATRKAHGILDGIDLQKIMEFIEFLIRLFALF